MTQPTKSKPSAHNRSLVWVLPERTARRLSWLAVILLGIVPLAVAAASVWMLVSGRTGRELAGQISARLDTPVRLKTEGFEAPGHLKLRDVVIGASGSLVRLSAEAGSYQQPDESDGTLSLRTGSLFMDCAWLTDYSLGPDRSLYRSSEKNRPLGAMTLSGFATELMLARTPARFTDCSAAAEMHENDTLRARLIGRYDNELVRVGLVLSARERLLTLSAAKLPWMDLLVEPILGKTLAGLLQPAKVRLTAGTPLPDGFSPADNWRLDFNGTLDLSRLPAEWKLAGMSGKVDVTFTAHGVLGHPGKLAASLSSMTLKGEKVKIPPAACQNLAYLLTGQKVTASEAFDGALEFSVVVTPSDCSLTGGGKGSEKGITTPAGALILAIPPNPIPLKTLQRRLEDLQKQP
jgi:hypothetical protein